mmetsp:Transcript_88380/g.253154  ORF Transcript_88380/g.253154 Transcript_88380/m.253154 type:complete len:250 (+) Transcript_88380:555-1304(+)
MPTSKAIPRCQEETLLSIQTCHREARVYSDHQLLAFLKRRVDNTVGVPHIAEEGREHPIHEATALDPARDVRDRRVAIVEPGGVARLRRVVRRVLEPVVIGIPSHPRIVIVEVHLRRELDRVVEDARRHEAAGEDGIARRGFPRGLRDAHLRHCVFIHHIAGQLCEDHGRLVGIVVLVKRRNLVHDRDRWRHVLRHSHVEHARVAEGAVLIEQLAVAGARRLPVLAVVLHGELHDLIGLDLHEYAKQQE